MGYDPRSAAVIGLCIGAVLLAAVLFPAAGIDSAPASAGGESTGVPAGDGSAGTDGGAGGVGAEDEADGSDDGSSTDGDGGSADDGGDSGAGSEDPSTDDDSPGTDDSTGSGADEGELDDGSASYEPTWIDRFIEAMTTVLMLEAVLFVITYVVVTGTNPSGMQRTGGVSNPLPDGPLPRLRVRLARIPQVTMLATIGVARRATVVETAFATLGRTVVRTGILAGSGAGTALRSVSTLSIGLPSLPRLRLPAFGSPGGSAGGTDEFPVEREASTLAEAASAVEDEGEPEPETVEEAWGRLVASLPVRRPSVRTPRECAAIALDAGLPRDAVERLTATFEAVRYGGAARTPTRLERVRDAYARIREARGGDR